MTAEIVPAAKMATLETLDQATRESTVTAYLAQARTQLALAVEMTGPAAVAALKAEIATAAEATKQLGLSKEIQQDAQEMVRRAEYALGKAIRAGQERGEIYSPGKNPYTGPRRGGTVDSDSSSARPVSDFAKPDELSGNGSGIYALADGVTEGQFETALTEAREEGNLSRANIVRKLKGTGKTRQFFTAAQRVEQIRDLSDSGKTSGQIGQELGIAETRVRELAREAAIVIAADATVRGSRRVDSNQIIAGTVEAAAIPSSALDLVVYSDLDRDHLREWISSLSESIKTLQALRSRLEKELNP